MIWRLPATPSIGKYPTIVNTVSANVGHQYMSCRITATRTLSQTSLSLAADFTM